MTDENQPLLSQNSRDGSDTGDSEQSSSNGSNRCCSSLIPCIMLFIGVLLISFAAWPLLPHEGTFLQNKDIGERSLIELSPYWYRQVQIALLDSIEGANLTSYLYLSQPSLTSQTTMLRKFYPNFTTRRYNIQHWNIIGSDSSQLNITWADFQQPVDLLILRGENALNLWLTWGIPPTESTLFEEQYTRQGSIVVDIPIQDDYYVVFKLPDTSNKYLVGNPIVHAIAQTPSWSLRSPSPLSHCTVSKDIPTCSLEIPDWAVSGWVLFSADSSKHSPEEKQVLEASSAISFKYTTKTRNTIISSLWPLWFILAVFVLITGLLSILAILGFTCQIMTSMILRCCPWILDDEDSIEEVATFNGYGTLGTFEPLPIYEPIVCVESPPPDFREAVLSPPSYQSCNIERDPSEM